MRSFALGVVLTLVVLVAGGYWYFASGRVPVATDSAPMPFETQLAKMALRARIHNEMPVGVPVKADETNFIQAVPLYRTNCAVCHGLPGSQPTAIAAGMFPHPPQLFKGKGVSDDPPGETYWKVTNGIRLTGMPAFQSTLSDTARWQVSVLLANSNHLSPQVLELLAAPGDDTAMPAVAKQQP